MNCTEAIDKIDDFLESLFFKNELEIFELRILKQLEELAKNINYYSEKR